MVKHEDLMQQTLLNAEGYLFAIDNRHPKFPVAVADIKTLNPEYVNLMAAAGLLYRSMGEATAFLEGLIEYLESNGLEEAVPHVTAIQATFDTTMKIAINGLSKKSQNMKKGT